VDTAYILALVALALLATIFVGLFLGIGYLSMPFRTRSWRRQIARIYTFRWEPAEELSTTERRVVKIGIVMLGAFLSLAIILAVIAATIR
jgi:hypothetical protein